MFNKGLNASRRELIRKLQFTPSLQKTTITSRPLYTRTSLLNAQKNQFMFTQSRFFSRPMPNGPNKNEDKETNEYADKFGDLLKDASKEQSNEEKAFFAAQAEAKRLADIEAVKQTSRLKADQEAKGEQDFDDLLSGKSQAAPQSAKEELHLAYSEIKAKMSKFKQMSTSANPMNSARSSLDSLSSKLEARRQAFMDKRKGKTETPADEQATHKEPEPEAEKKDQSVKMESSGEKAAEPKADPELKTETKATPDLEGEKEEKVKEAPKQGRADKIASFRDKLGQRYQDKKQQINDGYKAKNPEKHAKYLDKFMQAQDLWDETFPNPAREAQKKIDARKKKAKMVKEHEEKIKDMTEEELAAMEESIPEWKRSAIVVTEGLEQTKKKGIFGKMKDRVREKVYSSEQYKEFEQTEEYEKLKKLRKEVQEFKGDVKEQAEQSQSPMTQRALELKEKLSSDSPTGKAIREMQLYDKYFDIEDLTGEVQELGKETFCNYFSGNQAYMDKISAGQANAFFKAMIELRQKEKWTYKIEELLDIRLVTFMNARLIDGVPSFVYTLEVEEFNQRVDEKGNDIVDQSTSDGSIQLSTYALTIARHTTPDIELTGHYWEITEFQCISQLKQIL